jgi:type I restriction enzyme S subunit
MTEQLAMGLIADIPKKWKISRFRYNFSFGKGLNITKENLQDEGIPCVNYGEIHSKYGFEVNPEKHILKCVDEVYLDKSIKSLLSYGDFVFADTSEDIEGSGNFTYLNSNINVFAGYHTVITRPVEGIHHRFLAYVIDSISFRSQIRHRVKGVKVFSITQSVLKDTLVWFPTIEEQTAIANFLDQKTTKIDRAIAINEKLITLLKERKQNLIQNAITRGLNPNAPMRDSGVDWIGEIPIHWSVLPNFSLFTERVAPGRDGLPLLSVSIHTGVSTEEIDEEENIRGRVKIKDKTKYNLVQPHDIVFNMMRAWQGGIGAVSVEGMVSPAYIIATPNNKINTQYFEYQYRSPIFVQQMDRFSKGITDFRKRLYWDEFKRLNTITPPITEQAAIVTHINTESTKTNKAISLLQQQILKLKEYKATLINSAVTGKIKVA